MDKPLISEKLESLRRCLARLESKCPNAVEKLQSDIDIQDIVTINLTRAIQLCVDMAAHMISETDLPAPETMGGAFEGLKQLGIIDDETLLSMKKAVGFRDVAIHN